MSFPTTTQLKPIEQEFYDHTFGDFIQRKIKTIVDSNNFLDLLMLPNLEQKLIILFKDYITQQKILYDFLSALQEQTQLIKQKLQQDQYDLHNLKCSLFLELYGLKIKDTLHSAQELQNAVAESKIDKFLWDIRQIYQFSSESIQQFIKTIVKSLHKFLQEQPQFYNILKKLLDDQDFRSNELLDIVIVKQLTLPIQPVEDDISHGYYSHTLDDQNTRKSESMTDNSSSKAFSTQDSRNFLDILLSKKTTTLLQQKEGKKTAISTTKIISKTQKTNLNQRTLYMTHPLKYNSKRPQNQRVIYHYMNSYTKKVIDQ